jgi:hypothetical protein
MTRNSDREYYLARISAERAAAERAKSEAARAAHLSLAEQYQQLIAGGVAPGTANQE